MRPYHTDREKRARFSSLRRQLALLDGSGRAAAVLPFHAAAIDEVLPWGGLPMGSLHELGGGGADREEGAMPTAFLAGILARLSPRRPVLWCLTRRDLYAWGLALYGLAPQRLILVQTSHDEDILWAMEEGLRNARLAAVVGEVKTLPPLASRRLQLAAETSGIPGFVLNRRLSTIATSAVTRWRIAALPGDLVPSEPGIGRSRWRVELLRCRGGVPASWDVEASDATGLVSLSTILADRSAAAQKRIAG